MNSKNRRTQWLKSPVQKKMEKLRMGSEIEIHPYMGRRRRMHLSRTHYKIGNDEDCGITLDDPFVSADHAELFLHPADGTFSVRNVVSRNGIFLNGVPVEQAALPERGVLTIGRSRIIWRGEEEESRDIGGMIVADEGMRAILRKLKAASKSKLPILILGETGTGKELVARLVHGWSERAREDMVTVNGATLGGALAESELFGHRKGSFTGSTENRQGAVVLAHRSSLFLDEVGDIPEAAQVKLLRALESGELKALGSDRAEKSDFRLISATSRPLRKLANEERFRLDLYYRLAGYVVEIPPLRNRKADIKAIAAAVAMKAGLELSSAAEEKLMPHEWPGNVRELRAVMARAIMEARVNGEAVVDSRHIVLDQEHPRSLLLPFLPEDSPISLGELEKRLIFSLLEKNAGARKLTAEQLGISRSTLFKKMAKYGIPTGPRGCGNKLQRSSLGGAEAQLGA